MTKQKYDNSGIISRNKDKEEDGANPKWPDFKGYATVDGVDYWLSAWIKEGEKGKFMSIAFKPKEARRAQETRQEPRQEEFSREMDDEIPF